MAENKTGGAAGIFAKRVQKQLSRAQEKVLQRLGKTVETKDEQFEQCSQNLNKQQSDGNKLYKDVKAYFNAVKVMHETSKRLSQTLKDVYEPDWQGGEDLTLIMESEDLLWNDYEEKLADQTVRTMETYMSQFPDLKERVAKRGRKLVDYDSARHHLEALQNTKKKDEAKMAKAEEEFNKAQSVFEEINNELREELPAVYHSRIGCYVTVFQNISNLRDVFYKEMSKLNHELYNVMTKLENQHSDKVFIIKGVTSKRRSLMISAPIPCNTAFPPAESSLNENATPHPAQNGKESDSAGTEAETAGANETSVPGEEQANGSTPAPEAPPPDDTPPEARESEADLGSRAEAGEDSAEEESGEHQGGGPAEAAEESGGYQVDKSAPAEDSPKETASSQDEPTGSASGDTSPVGSDQPAMDPATASDSSASLSRTEQEEGEEADSAPDAQESAPTASPEHTPEGTPEGTPDAPDPELMQAEESESPASPDPEDDSPHEAGEGARDLPPGFLYKAVALKDHLTEEAGQLLFQEGEIILVIADAEQRPEGTATGVKERDWLQHRNPSDHKGTFPESLIERADPSPQV